MTVDTKPVRGRWLVAAVSMALFCVQVDYFAINLALPRMATDFGSTATDLQWIVSIYMVTLGALMVPAGRLADIFGRKRALLIGIAVFGLASLLCAIAPSVATLVGFRALQGGGAALIFPASVSVITNAFPPHQASRMIGLAYGIAGLGNAAGPLIGGLLTQTLGWRWIFALNIPLTAACAVIGGVAISESRDPDAPRRIDLAGLALLTSGIGVFTLAFDRAPAWGWWSPATFAALAGAAAGGVLSGRLAAGHPVRVMGITTVLSAVSLAMLAAARDWAMYVPALTACGFTLGLVYAFTTVATQAVVSPKRAGEAAGIALTAMIAMGGVGVAVAGTTLERLRANGMPIGDGVGLILAVLAAALLPAGLFVLAVAARTTARARL